MDGICSTHEHKREINIRFWSDCLKGRGLGKSMHICKNNIKLRRELDSSGSDQGLVENLVNALMKLRVP
jgi:hypothetical protein